jgi:hypothetical protein
VVNVWCVLCVRLVLSAMTASAVLLNNTKAVSCLLWRDGALECVRGRLAQSLPAGLAQLAPLLQSLGDRGGVSTVRLQPKLTHCR